MKTLARDGFAVLPGFFSASQMAAVKCRAHELIAAHHKEAAGRAASVFSTKQQQREPTRDEYFMGSGAEIRFFMEEADARAVNKIGHCLHDRDEVFRAFCYSAALRDVCGQLGFGDPRICQTMYILKGAHTGGEVSPHKDNAFLMTQPLSTYGLWCAVDDATQRNGCLFAVPGSHSQPPSHFFRADAGRTSAAWDAGYDPQQYGQMAREQGVPLEAASGTLVVLHGNLVHFSAANTSEHSREAFTMHVVEGSLPWREDNWLARQEFAKWPLSKARS